MTNNSIIVYDDNIRRIERGKLVTKHGASRCANKRCKRKVVYVVTLKQDLPSRYLDVCFKHCKTITIDNVRENIDTMPTFAEVANKTLAPIVQDIETSMKSLSKHF
jgi:hypothetical protein